MEKKSIDTKKESIKKSYKKPILEEMGNIRGLTLGSGGGYTDSDGQATSSTVRPPSLA